jgi:hypothetical protein
MYPFGTRAVGSVADAADPLTSSAPRGYAFRMSVLMIERFPPTCPAWTPGPATAGMAVAGSGVGPLQATSGAMVLPVGRRKRQYSVGAVADAACRGAET